MPGFRSLSALQHRYASKPKNRASSLSESGNRLRMTISHRHLKDPRSIVNRAVLTLQLRQCTCNHTSGERLWRQQRESALSSKITCWCGAWRKMLPAGLECHHHLECPYRPVSGSALVPVRGQTGRSKQYFQVPNLSVRIQPQPDLSRALPSIRSAGFTLESRYEHTRICLKVGRDFLDSPVLN
jgi:hypothetical protein